VHNQDRFKTILVIVIGFTAIGWFIKHRWGVETYLDEIAFGIGLVSIFIPVAAKWIEWAWLKFAMALGWVNSRILLSIIYFVFLLPIAWLSRLFTKDPLMLKAKNSPSLYVTRNHQYKKEDLENIW
jgi:hypothetical protein